MVKFHFACVVAAITCAGSVVAQDNQPAPPQVSKEHQFLARFAGTWDCEGEAFSEPDKPPAKIKSSMTGHLIGGFWAIVIVKTDDLGVPFHGQATFGYDSRKKKYVGTWADSMSDYLWPYEGIVDGNKLVLNSKGPNPADPKKMLKFRDTWEFKSRDLLVLTGEYEGPDGKWAIMMRTTCKRKN